MQIPIEEGLFEEKPGRPAILAGRCITCSEVFIPRSANCPNCGSEKTESARLGGKGVLYSYTIVRHPPSDYRGATTYTLGRVAFPEGLIVVGLIVDCSKPIVGMELDLVVRPLYKDEQGNSRLMFMFSPTKSEKGDSGR